MSLLTLVWCSFTGLVIGAAIVCLREWHMAKCAEHYDVGLWVGKTSALWNEPPSDRCCGQFYEEGELGR